MIEEPYATRPLTLGEVRQIQAMIGRELEGMGCAHFSLPFAGAILGLFAGLFALVPWIPILRSTFKVERVEWVFAAAGLVGIGVGGFGGMAVAGMIRDRRHPEALQLRRDLCKALAAEYRYPIHGAAILRWADELELPEEFKNEIAGAVLDLGEGRLLYLSGDALRHEEWSGPFPRSEVVLFYAQESRLLLTVAFGGDPINPLVDLKVPLEWTNLRHGQVFSGSLSTLAASMSKAIENRPA